MIFETEANAKARGAKILAYMLGGRSTSVCSPTGEANLKQAAVNVMRGAMQAAGVRPEEIGHINAHGLGTKDSDLAEAQAIHEVFGPRGSTIPVTALKGTLGNAGASCGSLETAGSIIGLSHGMIPPTVGCDQPDPACNLNIVRKTRNIVGRAMMPYC
jgi:3-oxoacyl-[acyl-carrier-protein] synthase II